MKESIEFLRKELMEAMDVAKLQWKSFLAAVVIIFGLYICSIYIPPGWVSWIAIAPPSLIVAITALARVNDIGVERMGKRWQVRKVGLIMAGAGAVMLLATPIVESPSFPTWRAVILMWGFALAWLTTPDHPPWDYYITGKYRFLSHPPGPRSPLNRFAMRMAEYQSPESLMRAQEEYERRQRDKAADDEVSGP